MRGSTQFFLGSTFSNGNCDLIPLQFFFILISINIKALLILQANILSLSLENSDCNSFAIFSNGGHFGFSTRLNFTILKPWSLIMRI